MIGRGFAADEVVVSRTHINLSIAPKVKRLLIVFSSIVVSTSGATTAVLPERFAGPGFFFIQRYSHVEPFSRHKEHDGLSKLPGFNEPYDIEIEQSRSHSHFLFFLRWHKSVSSIENKVETREHLRTIRITHLLQLLQTWNLTTEVERLSLLSWLGDLDK